MPEIEGTVTLDGTEVEGAVVRGVDQDTDSVVDTDTTDSNGDYTLQIGEDATVHVFVEYEDGDDLYNAESKPFIDVEEDVDVELVYDDFEHQNWDYYEPVGSMDPWSFDTTQTMEDDDVSVAADEASSSDMLQAYPGLTEELDNYPDRPNPVAFNVWASGEPRTWIGAGDPPASDGDENHYGVSIQWDNGRARVGKYEDGSWEGYLIEEDFDGVIDEYEEEWIQIRLNWDSSDVWAEAYDSDGAQIHDGTRVSDTAFDGDNLVIGAWDMDSEDEVYIARVFEPAED